MYDNISQVLSEDSDNNLSKKSEIVQRFIWRNYSTPNVFNKQSEEIRKEKFNTLITSLWSRYLKIEKIK